MKNLIVSLGVLSMLGACANDGKSPGTGGPAAVESTRSEPGQQTAKEITKDDAVRLAQTHLALKKTGWGEPNAVEEHEGKYYLTYETPEREQRLIGQRTLIVDQRTGVVTLQKRR